MIRIRVTYSRRLDEVTTYESVVTVEKLFPKDIREALASQVDETLRHVTLIHVTTLGKVLEGSE